jgi:uncharacterized secreted protein with C-terminal beta-propeller domain
MYFSSFFTKSADDGTGASDYSETNVQVKGVDEADFVKNDEKYIYVLAQDKLVIVDAYPAKDSNILSKTEVESEGYPTEMFVKDDRLMIFTSEYEEVFAIAEFDFMPRKRHTQITHAYIYDISDKENPKLISDYDVNGNYYDARMINDTVYFITKDYVNYYGSYVDTPVVRMNDIKIVSPEIYYFDNPENNYVFHTITSLNIKNENKVNAKTFLMGHSNTLYVSKNNIYVAYQKNLPWRYYETHSEDRFYKVVLPLLPETSRAKIQAVRNNAKLSSYEKWEEISSILEEMYNSMEESEKDSLIKKIEEAVEEYETKLEIERRKTIIHKIAIDGGNLDYIGKGEVSGHLLNQFSMDEYEDNLRLATTTQIWTSRESKQYNNVYILDKAMKQIGKIEEIAEDERIYSTRFIGEKLYMVTFKRIDPLFVIDLSDPKNPEILGELKIPGFSDYLHPYDEDHIIGIGKETAENEFGGTSIKGVKLSLFDVSDVNNPKQLDVYEIGEPGTDSEALREHKAFLFDKKKNLLVIPIREVKGKKYDSQYGYYRQNIWQGAYVLGLTPESGFELKGKVTHNDDEEDKCFVYNSRTESHIFSL